MDTNKLKKLTAIIIAVILVMSMCMTGISVTASELAYETDATSVMTEEVAVTTECCGYDPTANMTYPTEYIEQSTEEVTEPTEPLTEVVYVVAGNQEFIGSNWYGCYYDVPENVMTKISDVYELTVKDVPVQKAAQLKVVANYPDNTQEWLGDSYGNNIIFNITEDCDVTVTFNPDTKEIAVTGAGVQLKEEIEIEGMYAVGNGEDNWLNNVVWDPADDSNLMTEITDNVYQISYEHVTKYDLYELKFAANGVWADNWGGKYESSGIESEAVYNSSDNIRIDVPYELATIILTLDLTDFNYITKKGATFTVTVKNEDEEEPMTEPSTTLPGCTAPRSAKIVGDFNLGLFKVSDNIFKGNVALSAGEYSFKVEDQGRELGFGGTFTDTMYKIPYKYNWKSETTLRATGGKYTFTYELDSQCLTVYHTPQINEVAVFGHINKVLTKETDTVYTGSVRVSTGTYEFKINENGRVYSSTDLAFGTLDNAELTENEDTYISLTGRSGVCTFRYDTSTKTLSVTRAETDTATVSVVGDLDLEFTKVNDTKYIKTVELEAGLYSFRVNDRGTMRCFGYTFKDSIHKIEYNSKWVGETKLNATGGKYQFIYDRSTAQLTVYKIG